MGIGPDRTSPENKLANVGVGPLRVVPLDMEIDVNCEDAGSGNNNLISANGPPPLDDSREGCRVSPL